MRTIKEGFFGLSAKAEDWLFEWVRIGGKYFNNSGKKVPIPYDDSIAEEFAINNFNLPHTMTLYRGISLSVDKTRKEFYRDFRVSSIKELWDKRFVVDYDYPTSWTSDYAVALDFAGGGVESVVMVGIFKPQHTILYTPMFPQRIRGLDESEAVVKPGRYNVRFEKPDYDYEESDLED